MAADEFLTSLLDRCTRFAGRLVGDSDTAREVAAEALTRLLDHQDVLGDDPDHLLAWTLRVTRNLAVDVLRRQAREATVPCDEPVLPAAESEIVLRIAVLEAVRGLSEQQRQVVTQRYLLDRSQADVAAALRLRPGTVATHVNRALNKLRVSLSDTPTPMEDHPVKLTSTEQAADLIGTEHRVTARIVDRTPQVGLGVDIGIPAIYKSRTGLLGRVPRERAIGETLDCVVVDVNADGTPIVTEALSGDDAEKVNQALSKIRALRPGQRYTGRVSLIVPFGAFVVFNGLRGLVHSSELDNATPLEAGQDVQVEILDTDGRLGRVSLRLLP